MFVSCDTTLTSFHSQNIATLFFSALPIAKFPININTGLEHSITTIAAMKHILSEKKESKIIVFTYIPTPFFSEIYRKETFFC